MKASLRTAAAFSALLAALVLPARSQPRTEDQVQAVRLREAAPKVFLDAHQADMDFIRREISFVNFVRDRRIADVHVLVTTQSTGSGGREYTLEFIGRNGYFDLRNTLGYTTRQTDTPDEERRGLTRILKVGLVPYAAKTELGDFLNVNFEHRLPPEVSGDVWDSWVFGVGVSGNVSGESTRDHASLSGWASANRVTSRRKLRLGLSGNVNSSRFDVDETRISSAADSQSFSGLYVVSLDEHWSAGSWLSLSSSSYSNIELAVNPAPAVEYNVFPYAESTRRQLRLLYRVGFSFNEYQEETIYDKMRESVLGHTLTMTFEMKEPWGSISSSLQGSNLLTDFSRNRLEFWGGLNVHLMRGLAVSFSGRYSRINDQISLPKSGASLEEILLQRKMLATNYNYGLSVGLSYTFGSVYSNVVNPRFGR